MQNFAFKFQAVAEKTAKKFWGYFILPDPVEVFLRSADMSSTEIVDCTKTLIESYQETDGEFPNELVYFLHFLSTQKSRTAQDATLTLHANNLSATYPDVDIAL